MAGASRPRRRQPVQRRAGRHRVRARHRRVPAQSGKPDRILALAALSHWSPGTLPDDADQTIRETVFWTPPELTPPDDEDRINSSLCYGFIFDFCGVEIDRTTLDDADRPLRDHARLRHYSSSRHGGRPDPRRLCPGTRRRALRGICLRARRQLPDGNVRRLSAADHYRGAGSRNPSHGDAVAVHAARSKGRRRR